MDSIFKVSKARPSEEELEAVQRQALVAAWEALRPLREESDWDLTVKAILCAFQAVEVAQKKAYKEFREKKSVEKLSVDDYCDLNLDEWHIVATAISCARYSDLDAHPYSQIGYDIKAYMAACRAMMSYSEATSILQDGEPCGSYEAGNMLAHLFPEK